MLIAGAGGHARELMGIFHELDFQGEILLYDDATPADRPDIRLRHRIIRNPESAREFLAEQPLFALGTGKPQLRKLLFEKLLALGGQPFSVISPFARIGKNDVTLGEGLNIMTQAVITENIQIGTGSLIHINATIHHDCRVGRFCELSPGSQLLGGVIIEDMVSIGAGAVVLPGIKIGTGAVVGAGSIVTRNVGAGNTVKGNPAG